MALLALDAQLATSALDVAISRGPAQPSAFFRMLNWSSRWLSGPARGLRTPVEQSSGEHASRFYPTTCRRRPALCQWPSMPLLQHAAQPSPRDSDLSVLPKQIPSTEHMRSSSEHTCNTATSPPSCPQVSLSLVAALLLGLPAPVAATYASIEFLFAALLLMRSLALHAPPGAASAAGGSATADEALSLLRRLLDAREGALQVLRGSPAHLHGWFVGQPAAGNTSSETSTAHNNSSSHPQLGFAHITALLSSLLLRDAVPPSCTKSKALLHGAAAAFAHALGLDVSGQEHTAAASASAHGAQSAPEFLVRPDAPLMAAYR